MVPKVAVRHRLRRCTLGPKDQPFGHHLMRIGRRLAGHGAFGRGNGHHAIGQQDLAAEPAISWDVGQDSDVNRMIEHRAHDFLK